MAELSITELSSDIKKAINELKSRPEIENPIEHLESENAARVFVDDALSLSRKLLVSCGVMFVDEFIGLHMGKCWNN